MSDLQSIPIPPLSAPSPVLPLFLQAHQSAPQLPPPQTTASGVMKLVMTYDHLRGIIEKEGPRLPLPPPLINGPVVNGVVPGAQPQPQPQPQSVVGGVMVMNGVNGLKRERDEELIEDGIRRRKRLDTGDRKISSSPSISQDPSGGINGATFSGHHGPASHHGGPVIATSSTPAMTADNSHSQQPPPHLTHSQPQPPFNPMTSQISTQGPGQVHVQMGAPMRPSPIHTTSQLNAPQQSSPLGAISPTAGPQQPSHPSQLPNIRTSMPFSQQSHHPQQPHGGMNPQGPQQIPSQDPASQQQAIQQMQFRRQQQALIYQQHQARAAAANAAAGGGGLPPQANGLLPGAPGAQPTQVGPPQSGAAVTGAGIPGAGGSVAPNANPTFRSPQNAFSPQQQQAFIHQAVQTLKASGIGNGPLGPTGAPTNTLGTTHAPQMVGPVVQHLLKSSPGFLQLPFETQVQQLATLQMHLALRNRQSQAHQHQQQAQAQQAATSLVAGATAAGAGGPRPPSAVGSASGTMASTPTSAPAPPSSSHGMSPPPPPRSASVVPNVPGVGGDPRASGSPQSAVAPSPRLSQPPTNHSSDQQQHGQAGAPGSQPPFGYSSSPTTMNSPASGPSGMRPSSSASNRNVSASHYSMPAQQLLPGQQGQQSLQQPGPQHGPQVPQTPQQQHQQHHHPSQQQQQQQPVQSQQPQQSQQDQPRQGLVQPPPGSGPAQALQNGVYPNITPQQKYQMGLLQHMRQGMGPGPAAIAGGTGMGPGGYAATQQGYAPIDKMRAVNHLPMMAGMSMGGATGSGHSGNTGIDPNSMMGGHQTGVARPPSVHPGAAAGARNSPALNPQQLLAQQQHNHFR
ncbi:uncharacterized protein EI90DRAFT_381619 [Cantharellus anzutake]|uniref:uncharacterized protein n=1 Tax=Cantharellus anzutake TaxID=1750568 RepID=UPI0019037395|nr:uncharacterized protein EI90DRAFT_381619 [Cantharellus anzutake]KAF8334964.1 hypothetical protein EI90DRAFT_381619 [Cantharellus anzutake]